MPHLPTEATRRPVADFRRRMRPMNWPCGVHTVTPANGRATLAFLPGLGVSLRMPMTVTLLYIALGFRPCRHCLGAANQWLSGLRHASCLFTAPLAGEASVIDDWLCGISVGSFPATHRHTSRHYVPDNTEMTANSRFEIDA